MLIESVVNVIMHIRGKLRMIHIYIEEEQGGRRTWASETSTKIVFL